MMRLERDNLSLHLNAIKKVKQEVEALLTELVIDAILEAYANGDVCRADTYATKLGAF